MAKILLIVVLLVVSVAGFFIWQQNSSRDISQKISISNGKTKNATPSPEKSNQKEYRNEKYKFAVSIPKEWTIREFSDGEGVGLEVPGDENDNVVIDVLPMIQSNEEPIPPFDEYVKTAASREIQNYESLDTIKKVVTASGITGYDTTWNVQSMMGTGGGTGKSLPRAYFPLPEKYGQNTIQISLSDEMYLKPYEQILTSLRYTK